MKARWPSFRPVSYTHLDVYKRQPLPMMTAYKALGFDIANFPNAYHLFENEITLPLNTRMTDEDVDYVIENFVEIVKSL